MSMNISGAAGTAGPMAMSGASARMPPQQKMSQLFDKIDSAKSGSISQAQFGQAFNTMSPPAAIKAQGAAAIWGQLDPGGTGSVAKSDFVATMKGVIAATQTGTSATAASTLSAAGQSLDTLGSGSGINLLA